MKCAHQRNIPLCSQPQRFRTRKERAVAVTYIQFHLANAMAIVSIRNGLAGLILPNQRHAHPDKIYQIIWISASIAGIPHRRNYGYLMSQLTKSLRVGMYHASNAIHNGQKCIRKFTNTKHT